MQKKCNTPYCFLLLVQAATEAAVKINNGISGPELCLVCSHFPDSTADGCAVNIENNVTSFSFNVTQQSTFSPVQTGLESTELQSMRFKRVQ